jgi:hypothetical protein
MDRIVSLKGIKQRVLNSDSETIRSIYANLKEAVKLHLEGEDLSDFGLASNPTLLVTMEGERKSP